MVIIIIGIVIGKSFRTQERLKTQSGEESSSSGHFTFQLPSLNRVWASCRDTSGLVISAPWTNIGGWSTIDPEVAQHSEC